VIAILLKDLILHRFSSALVRSGIRQSRRVREPPGTMRTPGGFGREILTNAPFAKLAERYSWDGESHPAAQLLDDAIVRDGLADHGIAEDSGCRF